MELKSYLSILKRYRAVIIACMVLLIAVALAFSFLRTARSPQPLRDSIIGGFLGLLLGLGLASLLEYLDNSVRTSSELKELLQKPVLAEIPLSYKASAANSNSGGLEDCEILESVRTLRAHVLSLDMGKSMKTLLITSANNGEGRSLVALQLAKAFAAIGKETLLVDADLRKAEQSTQIAQEELGLAYLVRTNAPIERVLKKTSMEHLKYLPSGPLPDNPSELLSSGGMQTTFALLQADFEIIILDSSPLSRFADALVLASLTDEVIVVVEAESTEAVAVEAVKDLLTKPGINVLGAVLNKVKPGKKVNRMRRAHGQAHKVL